MLPPNIHFCKYYLEWQCNLTDQWNRSVENTDCGLRTADWRLRTRGKMQTECKMQTGVKCRPSINCSRGRVKGQIKSRKIHVNKHLLDDIYLLSQIQSFLSGTSSATQKHNRNLEPFFFIRAWIIDRLYFLLSVLSIVWETSRSGQFSIHLTVNWYNTMFMLK